MGIRNKKALLELKHTRVKALLLPVFGDKPIRLFRKIKCFNYTAPMIKKMRTDQKAWRINRHQENKSKLKCGQVRLDAEEE